MADTDKENDISQTQPLCADVIHKINIFHIWNYTFTTRTALHTMENNGKI